MTFDFVLGFVFNDGSWNCSEVKQTWGGAVGGVQGLLDAAVWTRLFGAPPSITAEDKRQEGDENAQCGETSAKLSHTHYTLIKLVRGL